MELVCIFFVIVEKEFSLFAGDFICPQSSASGVKPKEATAASW